MPSSRASAPFRDHPRGGARPPLRSHPRPLVVLRLLLWRARVPLVAVLVGCACAVVVSALRPAPPARSPVLLLDRTATAGERLSPDDVRVARVPLDLVPEGSLRDVADLPDSTLAVPVLPGLPVVAGLFTQASAHGPPGTVVAPVRFADPGVAAMLTPGTVVDVLASGDGFGGTDATGRVVARGALVLAGPGGAADPAPSAAGSGLGGGLLGGGAAEAESALVLLAVTAEEAVALAGASVLSAVFVE
jgi:pilus assembly protein CpaB